MNLRQNRKQNNQRKAPASKEAIPPRVALLIGTADSYGRGLHMGIAGYLEKHARWSISLSERSLAGAAPGSWIDTWSGEGIIARVENPMMANQVQSLGVPVVDVGDADQLNDIPRVVPDDEAIARVAFTHLREQRFAKLGICGWSDFAWSVRRCEAFCSFAEKEGLSCDVLMLPYLAAGDHDALVSWVGRLQKPVGIFTCNDDRGRQLLVACRSAGVAVPEEVAVIGVDDDPIPCGLSDPTLSSVRMDTWRIGFTAAELLDRMMAGESVAPDLHTISPLGMTSRRSTDFLAVDDPDLAAAVRFIRENACSGIDVADVCRAVALSRRALERRFSDLLDRTPYQEILRRRVERAQLLLATTDLPLKAVAREAAMRDDTHLIQVFSRITGQTPGTYRLKISPPPVANMT